MAENDRLEKLTIMLRQKPDDTFLLYGVALEHKKRGDASAAIEFLDRVIAIDPGYCYAYYQKGLVNESTGDVAAARQSYRAGIAAAEKKGDEHARSELATALSQIE